MRSVLAENLPFVTTGDIIGGAGGVAGAYRLAYGGFDKPDLS